MLPSVLVVAAGIFAALWGNSRMDSTSLLASQIQTTSALARGTESVFSGDSASSVPRPLPWPGATCG